MPSSACVKTIEATAACPIQMLRISAKVVLCKLYGYSEHVQKQSLILDTIEVQSFLNFLQSDPCFSKAIVFPICHYMRDVLMLNENKVAFMQWNAPAIILAVKEKHTDPTILTILDELISTMIKPISSPMRPTIVELPVSDGETVVLLDDNDNEPVKEFDHLTSNPYSLFDLFICAMKHFVLYTNEILCTSAEMTTFTVNSVTIMLSFVKDVMSFNQNSRSKIITFMAENPACLSCIVELINHWRGKHTHI